MDAATSPQLEQSLVEAEAEGNQRIVINLAAVPYISSSALRVLIIHLRSLRQAGGDLKLCCLPDRVLRVLRMTGLDNLLDISASEELAVWAFSDQTS